MTQRKKNILILVHNSININLKLFRSLIFHLNFVTNKQIKSFSYVFVIEIEAQQYSNDGVIFLITTSMLK